MLATFACAILCACPVPQQAAEGTAPALVRLGPTEPPASAAFGLRVDWGLRSLLPAAQPAGVRAGKVEPTIPAVAARLAERFDPWRFDARAWVAAARSAGAGFFVLEARDPSGFCLWDVPESDFDGPGSAAGLDLLAPLTHACAQAGLPLALADSGSGEAQALPIERASAGAVNAPGRPLPAQVRTAVADLVASRSRGEQPLYRLRARTDGTWSPADLRVLAGLGLWMERNAGAVNASSPSPLRHSPGAWITWTPKPGKEAGSTLYLALEDPLAGGEQRIRRIGNRSLGARFLGGDTPVSVRADRLDLVASWEGAPPPGPYPVLAIDLDGLPVPLEAPSIVAAAPEFVFRREVQLVAPSPRLAVHYTRDGSEPTTASPQWGSSPGADSLALDASCILRATSFLEGQPVSDSVEQRFRRVRPLPAIGLYGSRPGLLVEVWTGELGDGAPPDLESSLAERAPSRTVGAKRLRLPKTQQIGAEARRFRGFVRIDEPETYTFEVQTSSHLRFAIGDTPLVATDRAGTYRGHVSLSPGWHALELLWAHSAGTPAVLSVEYGIAGRPREEISPEDLVFVR